MLLASGDAREVRHLALRRLLQYHWNLLLIWVLVIILHNLLLGIYGILPLKGRLSISGIKRENI